MSDEVLKSFVVSLGWKIDGDGEKKLHNTIRSATTQAILLANAMENMASAVVKHVARVVTAFDQLNYASVRTNTSVQGLKSLQHGFSQVGGTAQQAMAVVESFTRSMRMNPGLTRFVKDLGVDQAKEGADQLLDVVEKLAKQPRYIGARQAEMLGIDEQSFDTMVRSLPLLRAARESYAASAKAIGLNSKAAAEASTALNREWGRLAGTASVVGERFAADLIPHVTRFLKFLNEWVDRHSAEIGRVMDDVKRYADKLADGFKGLAAAASPIVDRFQAIAESLTGEKGLKASLDLFLGFLLGTWVVKVLAGFGAVGSGWAAMLLRLGIPIGIGMAASGGGHQTPEQYRESLRNDPGRAQADAELNKNGGAAKRWWRRTMPTWLGGAPAGSPELTGGGQGGEEAAPGRFSALKALIQGVESGAHKYNSVYGNGEYGWPDKPVTEMTVAEALAYQRSEKAKHGTRAFPVGRGQFVERTLRGLAQEHNAFDQKMTPELQEKFMDTLIRRRGRDVRQLRLEWEGLNGVSADRILGAYDKDGSAPASKAATTITPQQIQKMRESILTPMSTIPLKISLGDFEARFGTPLPMGASAINNSTADNRSFKVEHKTDISISGASDPTTTANRVKETLDKGTGLSLRNAQSPSR